MDLKNKKQNMNIAALYNIVRDHDLISSSLPAALATLAYHHEKATIRLCFLATQCAVSMVTFQNQNNAPKILGNPVGTAILELRGKTTFK